MANLDLAAVKSAAREAALARRAACDPAWGIHLTDHVLRGCPPPPGAIVAGFWPLPGEIDIRPLLLVLAERGHTLCLPETPKRGLPLTFRRWSPGDALLPGRFGTQHPAGDSLIPEFILVPLLSFDSRGNRLGYGGGFYDRTLVMLPDAFRLGCAFAAQEMSSVPVGKSDLQLNGVATERGTTRFYN